MSSDEPKAIKHTHKNANVSEEMHLIVGMNIYSEASCYFLARIGKELKSQTFSLEAASKSQLKTKIKIKT